MIKSLQRVFQMQITRRLLEIFVKMKKFYKTEEEFKDFYVKLKLIMCPYCNVRGCLILHGYLYGYSETDMSRIKRGHRIFCSNRKKKHGCGRTFSILVSVFVKNFMISARTLWRFLEKVKEGTSLAGAFRDSGSHMGQTSTYRIFRKFRYNQVRIRTLLTGIKDPPGLKQVTDAAIQTIIHLKSVFRHSSCPVSKFQHHFQTSFL